MLCAQDLSKCQVPSTCTTLQAVKNQQATNVFLKCGSWVNSRLGQPLSEPPENRRQEPKPIAWKDMYIGIMFGVLFEDVNDPMWKSSHWKPPIDTTQRGTMVDIKWVLAVGIPQDRFTTFDPFEHLWDTYVGKKCCQKSTKDLTGASGIKTT